MRWQPIIFVLRGPLLLNLLLFGRHVRPRFQNIGHFFAKKFIFYLRSHVAQAGLPCFWTGYEVSTHHFRFVGTQTVEFNPIWKTCSALFSKYWVFLCEKVHFSCIFYVRSYVTPAGLPCFWTGYEVATHCFRFAGTPTVELSPNSKTCSALFAIYQAFSSKKVNFSQIFCVRLHVSQAGLTCSCARLRLATH